MSGPDDMSGLRGKLPVVISQDLVWGDMDAFQHINNTVYFRYFEDVRIAFFEKAGVIEEMNKSQIGPILASTHCNFRLPLDFPDTIQVGVRVDDIKTNRFTMKYSIYSEQLGKVAADGDGLIVYYDYRQKKSCAIPDTILTSIQVLQAGF